MKRKFVALLVGIFVLPVAYGYEISGPVSITQLRPLESAIYFSVNAAAICNEGTFSVDLSQPGGKEIYATLLTAAATGRQVYLETWANCPSSTWGMAVGGVTVNYP